MPLTPHADTRDRGDLGIPAEQQAILRRDWAKFTALTFLFGFGFSVYNGVFQNFMKDVINAQPLQIGFVESTREVPGLLTALLAGSLVAFAESRIAALGLLIGAIGLAATGFVTKIPPLIAVSVFWSTGFHLWSTVQSAITLALAKGREGGRHLGRMAGVGAGATIAGLGASLLLTQFIGRNYPVFFFAGGGLVLAAAIICRTLSTHAEGGKRQAIVVRREYRLYYLLTFLEGCRRQIFGIFATYTLVLVYKAPLTTMLALQFVNAILIAFTAPAMGRLIDRIGERKPLMHYAAALLLVFVAYATVRDLRLLCALYLIDNVLFSFGVGFTTYLNRIVRPGELTPSLAMGTTMNHVAAVVVPVAGAFLWQQTHNYQLPFWVGAGIAVVSLVATSKLPRGVTQRA